VNRPKDVGYVKT